MLDTKLGIVMNILAYSTSHNCSAALMCGGKIVGLIQEERFSKRKNQTGYPKNAIDSLIARHLGGDSSKLDHVLVSGYEDNPFWIALDHYTHFGVKEWVLEMKEYWYPYFYGDRNSVKNYFWDQFMRRENLSEGHNFDFSFLKDTAREDAQRHFCHHERVDVLRRHIHWPTDKSVEAIEHHRCHAYYALYGGNNLDDFNQNSLIMTADSWGDDGNWSVGIASENGSIERLASGPDNMVARIYKFVTLILGMKPNEHEYKVMGLSGYSKSESHIHDVEDIFFKALDFRDGCFVSELPLKDSYFDLKDRLEGHRFDNISAGLQNWATKVTISWIQHWIGKTNISNLHLSGGLFMNIKMNGEILKMSEVSTLSIPASGGDESLPVGACYAKAIECGEVCQPMNHVYLGDPAESGKPWQARLSETDMSPDQFSVMEGVGPKEVAKLLAGDLIVARCAGDAEFGARSLGNRSILANPSNPDNIKTINDFIKNRDFWMPFTPSILIEYANAYLDNPKECVSPYMTIGFNSREENRQDILGGLHPGDFSARPQFVQKDANPDYWELIDEFRKLTGIPAVMNTSLNMHGDPMNYDLADAARTLAKSCLSILIMPGDQLLFKNSEKEKLHAALEI